MTLTELQAMSDEEMNAKIAELRGWKREIRRSYRETPGWFHPNGVSLFDAPPRYTEDLNACAEFERGLADEERWSYLEKLGTGPSQFFTWNCCHATARHRCEAFLMTKGVQP